VIVEEKPHGLKGAVGRRMKLFTHLAGEAPTSIERPARRSDIDQHPATPDGSYRLQPDDDSVMV
jgi:hypothetical protein